MSKQLFTRSAGILLPVSSLPSPYGIGSFGEAARRWIDFLHDAGQSYWQVLPLGLTDKWGSPYSSPSAFAGNHLYIDLDTLRDDGLLKPAEYRNLDWGKSAKRVDHTAVTKHREGVLRKAFSRFKDDSALEDFAERNSWAEEFGLYMAVRAAQGGASWTKWPEPLRLRRIDAMQKIREELKEEVRYHIFVQYLQMRQWQDLHSYALSKGIEIIGDIPIYVSLDSPGPWINPGLFQLDRDSVPKEVSGCPPDKFTDDGQVWGNPLYDWNAMKKTGYTWWMSRLKRSFELYDILRIDHFRGLESYFAIPGDDKTAKRGRWKPGPGKSFIDSIRDTLPDAGIIAEDLGYITKAVRELVSYSGYPSMKVLQFAFDTRVRGKEFLPDTYGTNTVVYTGTHDNDTLKGWSKTSSAASVEKAMAYLGIKKIRDLPLAMIRLALECDSNLAIIPMQDWLELSSNARLNTPSTVGKKNWSWRLEEDMLTDRLAAKISEITDICGRSPK